MTEERINALRQADRNLRDALKMDEAELPPLPADLNERLMQRLADEERPTRRRIVWPWIAAACVAGVMMIWLTPPKEQTPTVAQQTPSPALPLNGKGVVSPEAEKVEEPVVVKVETEVEKPAIAQVKVRKRVERNQEPMNTPTTQATEPTTQATEPTPQAAEPTTNLAAVQKKEVSTPLPSGEGQGRGSVVTLTERDIPVTRPENYQYTPEELALMKKQANEAYLKWAQLELEIAKHHLEQAAQNNKQ